MDSQIKPWVSELKERKDTNKYHEM